LENGHVSERCWEKRQQQRVGRASNIPAAVPPEVRHVQREAVGTGKETKGEARIGAGLVDGVAVDGELVAGGAEVVAGGVEALRCLGRGVDDVERPAGQHTSVGSCRRGRRRKKG
jgi:hypothetical protein